MLIVIFLRGHKTVTTEKGKNIYVDFFSWFSYHLLFLFLPNMHNYIQFCVCFVLFSGCIVPCVWLMPMCVKDMEIHLKTTSFSWGRSCLCKSNTQKSSFCNPFYCIGFMNVIHYSWQSISLNKRFLFFSMLIFGIQPFFFASTIDLSFLISHFFLLLINL